jgi:hypothetical protein
MEIPSHPSVVKIFSTVLSMNLTPVFEGTGNLAVVEIEKAAKMTMSAKSQVYSKHAGMFRTSHVAAEDHSSPQDGVQRLVDYLLEATLDVYKEAEFTEDRRLHGLARVFWDMSHTFSMVQPDQLRGLQDVGRLWAYVMRLCSGCIPPTIRAANEAEACLQCNPTRLYQRFRS